MAAIRIPKETLSTLLALHPMDQHTGLFYAPSSADDTIASYRLLYNFNGNSVSNALLEGIDSNQQLQGCFIVTCHDEGSTGVDQARELSLVLFKQVMTSMLRIIMNDGIKKEAAQRVQEICSRAIVLVILRGVCQVDHEGDVLAVDLFGFGWPYSVEDLAKHAASVDKSISEIDLEAIELESPKVTLPFPSRPSHTPPPR